MATISESSNDDVYDGVTIGFHWLTATLVIAMFVLVLVPGIVKGSVELHKAIGMILAVVVVARIVWRLSKGRRTSTSAGEPLLVRLAAKGAHLALYGLLIVLPVLGWMYQDAKGMEVYFVGVELPPLIYYDRELAMQIYNWKQVVAYALLALVLVHAAVALIYHARMRRDGVLRSMLPARWRGAPAP